MKRFERVRLRKGLGGLHPGEGPALPPPDGASFGVAPGYAEGYLPFHVVDWVGAKGGVAVVSNQGRPLFFDDETARIARRLLVSGFDAVAWIGSEALGAAVVHAFGDAPTTLDEAACAAWAVKALGGWDESPLMVFPATHVSSAAHDGRGTYDATWSSVRGAFRSGEWVVEAWRLRRGSWTTLLDDLASCADGSQRSVLLADVDWAMAYNDAMGHPAGDVMLARVHACIEEEALLRKARFLRVAGDEFAVVLEGGPSEALELAEALQCKLAAVNLPFNHPEVRTHGRVTLSMGIAAVGELSALRPTLEDAVDVAKRTGRNRITSRA